MDVFLHYAPFIQDYIYEHGWQNLRSIQVAAAEEIFNTDHNVLLSASTASGKTEAAFFPILSDIYEEKQDSVKVLYIAPLKALINDQYERLTELCQDCRHSNLALAWGCIIESKEKDVEASLRCFTNNSRIIGKFHD